MIDRQSVLFMLRTFFPDGATTREIAVRMGQPAEAENVGDALRRLAKQGRVERSGRARANCGGQPCTVWLAVAKGGA